MPAPSARRGQPRVILAFTVSLLGCVFFLLVHWEFLALKETHTPAPTKQQPTPLGPAATVPQQKLPLEVETASLKSKPQSSKAQQGQQGKAQAAPRSSASKPSADRKPDTPSSKKKMSGRKQDGIKTVVIVSDTHGLYLQPDKLAVPPGDLLLFAGDVELRSADRWKHFLAWMKQLPHKYKAVTWGNMDMYAEELGPDAPEWGQAADAGVHIVWDTVVELGGVRIFGSPNTPKFFGAFQLEDQEAARQHWTRVLPPDTRVDIILTHGPPYGAGDLRKSLHRGDKALLSAVQALHHPPVLWACGHIHDGRGTYAVEHPKGEILLVNAAVEHIKGGWPEKQPFIVDIHTRRVTVGKPPGGKAS